MFKIKQSDSFFHRKLVEKYDEILFENFVNSFQLENHQFFNPNSDLPCSKMQFVVSLFHARLHLPATENELNCPEGENGCASAGLSAQLMQQTKASNQN